MLLFFFGRPLQKAGKLLLFLALCRPWTEGRTEPPLGLRQKHFLLCTGFWMPLYLRLYFFSRRETDAQPRKKKRPANRPKKYAPSFSPDVCACRITRPIGKPIRRCVFCIRYSIICRKTNWNGMGRRKGVS